MMKLLKVSYDEAKRLLSANREALDKIADFLIQREDYHRQRVHEDFQRRSRESKSQKRKSGSAKKMEPCRLRQKMKHRRARLVHRQKMKHQWIRLMFRRTGAASVSQSPEQDTVIRTVSGSSAEEEEKK